MQAVAPSLKLKFRLGRFAGFSKNRMKASSKQQRHGNAVDMSLTVDPVRRQC